MNCDCASTHLLLAKTLLEGLEKEHLFLASHCSKCGEYIQGWSQKGQEFEQISSGTTHFNVKVKEFPWRERIETLLNGDPMRNIVTGELSPKSIATRIRGRPVSVQEEFQIARDEWDSVVVVLMNHPAPGIAVTARELLFVLKTSWNAADRFFPPGEKKKKPWWRFW